MTAVDPGTRVRHPLDVFHSTFNPDGTNVAAGMIPMADGLGQVEYVDASSIVSSDTIDANAAPYSCANDGVTDMTAGRQAAIDAAYTAAAAGNGIGIVEYDEGIYLHSGALQTTGNYYAQVMLPTRAVTSSKVVIIERPKRRSGVGLPSGFQSTTQLGAVVFKSSLTGQTYSGTHGTPSVTGGPDPQKTGTFSNVCYISQGISYRQAANPSLCNLNLQLMYQAIVEDSFHDTSDTVAGGITQPTAVTGIAVLMPIVNNNALAEYRGNNWAIGYYAGFGISEHSNAENLTAYRCYVGLNIQGDYYHAAIVQLATVEHCPYVIATVDPSAGIVNPTGASGYATFNIDLLTIEDATSTWAVPTYHVNDPGNDYHGRVRYLRVVPGTGTVTGALTVNGATNLARDDLTTLPSSGGAPTTADYLVGTANGSLSAEIVVGTTPNGELGGTWGAITVDGTHSGSAHADFIAKAFIAAKGDLIGASANDTPAIVTVGSDGKVLTADSTVSAGVSWQTPGSAHYLVVASSHSTPLIFGDLVQTSAGDDLIYTS